MFSGILNTCICIYVNYVGSKFSFNVVDHFRFVYRTGIKYTYNSLANPIGTRFFIFFS